MIDDSKYIITQALVLVNKLYDCLTSLSNSETDGRFKGFAVQAYGLKQDIEDKMREDLVDGGVKIANAPNLPPTQNKNTNPPNNGAIPNTGSMKPTNNVGGNGNTVTQQSNPINSPPNQNFGNPSISKSAQDFFNDLLQGKVSNSQDLDDLLNQNQNQAVPDDGNTAPF